MAASHLRTAKPRFGARLLGRRVEHSLQLQDRRYELNGRLGEQKVHYGTIQVEEYRVPLFSVELEPRRAARRRRAGESLLQLLSRRAQCRRARALDRRLVVASFAGEDRFVRYDQQSEHHSDENDEVEASGDAVLDGQGEALLPVRPLSR